MSLAEYSLTTSYTQNLTLFRLNSKRTKGSTVEYELPFFFCYTQCYIPARRLISTVSPFIVTVALASQVPSP